MATLAKARLMTRRVSRSNPGAATFALMTRVTIGRQSCKVEKERLLPTTPASVMITLALIGAWRNSLDRMPAVILVSPLLNYFFYESGIQMRNGPKCILAFNWCSLSSLTNVNCESKGRKIVNG